MKKNKSIENKEAITPSIKFEASIKEINGEYYFEIPNDVIEGFGLDENTYVDVTLTEIEK